MSRISYNSLKNHYKLRMSYDELLLITKFLSQVRLGTDNAATAAAEALCAALEEFDTGIFDEVFGEPDFSLTAVLENDDGDEVLIIDGDDLIFELGADRSL
jgi:hypothetical protein